MNFKYMDGMVMFCADYKSSQNITIPSIYLKFMILHGLNYLGICSMQQCSAFSPVSYLIHWYHMALLDIAFVLRLAEPCTKNVFLLQQT